MILNSVLHLAVGNLVVGNVVYHDAIAFDHRSMIVDGCKYRFHIHLIGDVPFFA